jgi:GAF domain-containing protein
MTRRSKAGGEPIKGRRRKAPEPKLRNAPKVQARAKLSLASEETEVARLSRELNEALDRQNATSEVLRVISSSRGDLAPVFDAVLQNATRICRAKFGIMNFPEPGGVRCVAMHNVPEAFAELRRHDPVVHFGPKHPLARAVATKQVVHIPDLEQDAGTDGGDVVIAKFCELTGARTILHAPMLKEKELVGIVSIYRQEVRPFTDKQIDLVKNFAAQAVIAIENARLLNELRQRTTDLSEALEQQTATSEVLQVISSSPGDLEPVFAAILNNAVRICAALNATLWSFENDRFHFLARYSEMPGSVSDPIQPGANSGLGRVRSTKQIVHITDYAAEPAYLERDPFAVRVVEELGIRTNLSVPMLQDNELVGAFSIYRTTVKPFSEKQIELIAGFAAQAVIAIENARLLNELRQRTADLAEALEQQTATSEVLQVISGSPGDLRPVFAAMLENAARICDANFGNIFRWDGDALWLVATHNTPAAFIEHRRRVPFRPNQGNPIGDMLKANVAIHVADLAADERYITQSDPEVVAAVELGSIRTFVAVPMLKDKMLIGAVIVYRQEVRPFSKKQIELVKNFAAQAVVAIENVRLLSELRQSLEQQTATSEVLQVISASPGELEPVFTTILEKAVRICDAKYGSLYLRENGKLRLVAAHDVPELLEARRGVAFDPAPDGGLDEAIRNKCAVQIPDLAATSSYMERHPGMVEAVELAGIRTGVAVPMLKDDEVIGVIAIHRREVLPFTGKQVELLTNFAAPSRHRHRERAAAQRIEAVAGAANRHSRRSRGYQPLDV